MAGLQFETPENVSVDFSPAGLGTRFVAWFVDQIFVWILTIALILAAACAGVSVQGVEELFRGVDEGDGESAMIIVGLVMLIWGLGSFVYFGACELFMRGQTPGKRISRIRVVKADGFSLDAPGILIRNVFRVVDQIPALWIVPVLSARSQRAGDMVAGTVVVSDETPNLSSVRIELAERSALESEFRFQQSGLATLTDVDVRGVEQLLARWNSMASEQREMLLEKMTTTLSRKLNMDPPPPHQRLRFAEDLLAAELRRQHRGLG
ncbi:MAG: RDD family protein [Planctomycetaceae bacterium]